MPVICRHDVTGIALVVEGRRACGGAVGLIGCACCGLLSGTVKIHHAAVGIGELFRRHRLMIEPLHDRKGFFRVFAVQPAVGVGVGKPHHVPEIRVDSPALPAIRQRCCQQVSHFPALPAQPAAACAGRHCPPAPPSGRQAVRDSSRAACACSFWPVPGAAPGS